MQIQTINLHHPREYLTSASWLVFQLFLSDLAKRKGSCFTASLSLPFGILFSVSFLPFCLLGFLGCPACTLSDDFILGRIPAINGPVLHKRDEPKEATIHPLHCCSIVLACSSPSHSTFCPAGFLFGVKREGRRTWELLLLHLPSWERWRQMGTWSHCCPLLS